MYLHAQKRLVAPNVTNCLFVLQFLFPGFFAEAELENLQALIDHACMRGHSSLLAVQVCVVPLNLSLSFVFCTAL